MTRQRQLQGLWPGDGRMPSFAGMSGLLIRQQFTNGCSSTHMLNRWIFGEVFRAWTSARLSSTGAISRGANRVCSAKSCVSLSFSAKSLVASSGSSSLSKMSPQWTSLLVTRFLSPWGLSLTVYNVHKRFLFRGRVIAGRTRSYLHFLGSRWLIRVTTWKLKHFVSIQRPRNGCVRIRHGIPQMLA